MKVRVKRTSRGLKQSNHRTHRWLCPVNSTPTEPTVLTHSIIKFVCVAEDNCRNLFSPPTTWVPETELRPGPGQASSPAELSCCLPITPLKTRTLAGCDAGHSGGRHRWFWVWDQAGLHSKFQTSLAPTCICMYIYTHHAQLSEKSKNSYCKSELICFLTNCAVFLKLWAVQQ